MKQQSRRILAVLAGVVIGGCADAENVPERKPAASGARAVCEIVPADAVTAVLVEELGRSGALTSADSSPGFCTYRFGKDGRVRVSVAGTSRGPTPAASLVAQEPGRPLAKTLRMVEGRKGQTSIRIVVQYDGQEASRISARMRELVLERV